MDWNNLLFSLFGGVLIGFAVTVMLLFNGRVTGISGILASSLSRQDKDGLWKWFLLAGLVTGGVVMKTIQPELFTNSSGRSLIIVLFAGLFVGYGTVMGSGCTSGHGICGISRLSIRSILATVTFMLFGFFTVQLLRYFSGGSL